VSVMLSYGADVCTALPGEELQADCSSGCSVSYLVPLLSSSSLSTNCTALYPRK
jgi:hypothetical protein